MKLTKSIIFTGIFSAGLAMICLPAFSADENDIKTLEKELIQKELKLLEPELRLDQLQKERSKYDGFSGWFQGSKKKALDAQIEKQNKLADQAYREMKTVSDQVQKMVYSVAYSYEKHGNYKKAIEYYLKVENRTDKIRFRIAGCHKALKDYQQAIKWLFEMRRSDPTLLEVVDCYRLDGRMKDSIYWLFEILEPYSANSAELTALKLIEEYDYPQKQTDFPNFARRLSDVYLVKATQAYQSNFVQATNDYKKAVDLLADEMGASPAKVSFSILDRSQNDYNAALQILQRQREAAERNFEDKLRRAREEIDDAERDLRRARIDADRHYNYKLDNARRHLERAREKLKEVQNSETSTEFDIDNAKRDLDRAERDYHYVQDNKYRIIRDYLRPYQEDVREAEEEYDDLLDRRSEIIASYIAPYKKKVQQAQAAYERIRALHEANFNY
jgi:hypothetical protein